MSKIRLTETQLHKVISESVKKVLNEGGYYNPWWDSKHQMWHDNDGTCDYIDFDNMDDDNLMQMYQETLEWFNHVPREKWMQHSPDKYAQYKALQQELKERGIL